MGCVVGCLEGRPQEGPTTRCSPIRWRRAVRRQREPGANLSANQPHLTSKNKKIIAFLRSFWGGMHPTKEALLECGDADRHRIPYTLYGICIGTYTVRMGSVSDRIQSAWDLYRTPCTPYGICLGPHTLCMRSVSDPTQSVWDLYRFPYSPYGVCIGPRTLRMGSVSDPIQSAWGLYRTPCTP